MNYGSLLFLHIPKTGGTTLRSVITRQYSSHETYEIANPINESLRSYRESSAARRLQYRVLQGHMSFGLHEFMSPDFAYVTMLREPLRRAVSDYTFVSTNTLHPLYESVSNMSFSEYMTSKMTGQLENGQTRLISGDSEDNDIGIPTVRAMGQKDLDRALDNLQKHFPVVGLLERFDESLLLMRHTLEWRLPFYVRENVTSTGAKPRLTTTDLETVRALNTFDDALYSYASERLDKKIGKQGERFQQDLSRFRLLNRAWSSTRSLSVSRLRSRLGRLKKAVLTR